MTYANQIKLVNLILLSQVFSFALQISNATTNEAADIDTVVRLDRISLNGKWFVDSNGHVRLFRGVNSVKKAFPWIPNDLHVDMTNKTQLSNLKRWGFNVVRLGVMWAGVMPSKNFINQTYIDEIVKIVADLESFGMYTIVDLHQDVMSSKFEGYDGVPLWVLDEIPKPMFKYPWPLTDPSAKSFFAGYLTEACGHAFQCLYDNCNGFEDYFHQYWSIIAKTFANNTAILGYELLNEPWAGNIYKNPLLLLSTFAGRDNLLPFYDRVYETIRRYDSDTLVFYEPVTWGVLGSDKELFGTGFNRAPGNDVKKTVFSWHYYCWLLAAEPNPLKNGTYPEFLKVLCDQVQLFDSHEVVKRDMLSIGNGASFLTEFGVCVFNNSTPSRPNNYNTFECESVLNANDEYMTSWTYWDSNFYDVDNGFKLLDQVIEIFSRVYPMETNGMPGSLYFNTTTKEFSYTFSMEVTRDYRTKLATKIFIPAHVYPDGFKVNLSPGLISHFDADARSLMVEMSDNLFMERDFVSKLSVFINADQS